MDGDLVTGGVIVWGMCHNRLLWMYLEDILFNDLNQFNMMNYVISYTSWLIAPVTIYLLQIYLLNNDLQLEVFKNMNSKYQTMFGYLRPRIDGNYTQLSYANPDHWIIFVIV